MKQCFTSLFFSLCVVLSFAQPSNDLCENAEAIGEVTDYSFSTIDANTDGPYHENSPCPSNSEVGQDSIFNDIWYAYTPSFSGLAVWSMCSTADFDTKIAVYNPGVSCPLSDGDLLDCNEDAGGCDNATSEIIWEVVQGETYILRLGGYGMTTPGEEGSGTFTIEEFISAVPNDFCANALPVSLGLDQEFTTVGTTTDGPDHVGDNVCFGFNFATASNDIWYTYTPDFTGSVQWSTCDQISFDSRLVVYGPNVSCPVSQADMLICNDDGTGCGNFTSNLFFDVEEGNTYLLRLGSFGDEVGLGTFDLINNTPPEPPANDDCANAELIPINAPGQAEGVTGTTIAATFDVNNFEFPSCLGNTSGGEFADVWYMFNSGENTEIEIQFGSLTQDALYFVDLFSDCSTQVDSIQFPDDCFFFDASSGVQLFIDTLGVFPGVPTDYYLRVITRVTTDLPGDFFIELQGNNEVSSINEIDGVQAFTFYPNPYSDGPAFANVVVDNRKSVSIELSDMIGRTVYRQNNVSLNSGSNTIPIEFDQLDSGIYLMSLRHENQIKTIKIVKQ